MLNELKTFDADRCNLDQLVELSAFGRNLRNEYEFHGVDEPEWLDVQMKSLKRVINARVSDQLEARKRKLENQLESLKTPAQKKRELEKELAEINKQLTPA